MKRDYGDYIDDIISHMQKAEDFIMNINYEDFAKDEKTIFAVIRALEVVGEAAKQIPGSIRRKYPEIPWKRIAGMRDRLIHEYFGVKLMRVWDTVKIEIPPLKPLFEKVRKDMVNKETEQ
jgi:uncharacterized protein with HEPN domain